MKTSRVVEVVNIKPYNGTNGTVYYHLLKMDNGDKINIGKKKELTVGTELTYEMIETGQQEYNKSKSVQPEQPSFKPKSSSGNVASFALAYANQYAYTSGIGKANAEIKEIGDFVTALADIYIEWLNKH